MAGKLKVIKRWFDMLTGKSVFHMKQSEGKYYVAGEIAGYYSDLRHKVEGAALLGNDGVPYNQTSKGENIHFAINIFQYGLGAYDLYLETKEEKYKEKFLIAVKWAKENQLNNGAWNAFGWVTPEAPYSSMAQSEGASLLCRAYKETKCQEYLDNATKAIEFMLLPVDEGGTSYYNQENITLEEASDERTILNGMMFSIWGLYDLCLLNDDKKMKLALDKVVQTLRRILKDYDRGYWSNYDLENNIASPFYHDLHIEQLKVMYNLFGCDEFKQMCHKWENYKKSFIKSKYAFIVKAIQKLKKIEDEVAIVK